MTPITLADLGVYMAFVTGLACGAIVMWMYFRKDDFDE